jgi:hypothetical protein
MERVKFLKEYTHPGGGVSKKGKTLSVTSRFASMLVKDKIAEIVEGAEEKEDKGAKGRETK